MSAADEDTFEIDIYGDEPPALETKVRATQDEAKPDASEEDIQIDFNEDQGAATQAEAVSERAETADTTQADQASHGTKRKAPADEEDYEETELPADSRPVDPGALPALKLAELHWWTTEDDLRAFCVRAGVEDELSDLAFGEHKQNGKSRGEAYIEFSSPQAATAVKRAIENAEMPSSAAEGGASVKKGPFSVAFTFVGNPYKTAAAQAAKKDYGNSSGTQNYARGGYNNFNNRGRNYNNNYNSRGNYGNNNMMQNRQNWNMNGMNGMNSMNGMTNMNNMNGMGGYGNAGFNNPMMTGMMGGNMNVMGFNAGMMPMGGNMNIGRGGFGMNQMGAGMNMGMRGGRGGWNSGFQQQGFQGGGGGGTGNAQQQPGNKRPKIE